LRGVTAKRLIALMLGAVLVTLVYAVQEAQLRAEEDAISVADAMMERIVTGDYHAAFEHMRSYWPAVAASELDNLLNSTVVQRTQLETRFGESLDYEFIRSRRAGDSLLQLIYIEKTERHALRWTFRFYKPHDSWLLNNIGWSDDISELFDE
jgi:type II secretory pathway pseudopilin PulG